MRDDREIPTADAEAVATPPPGHPARNRLSPAQDGRGREPEESAGTRVKKNHRGEQAPKAHEAQPDYTDAENEFMRAMEEYKRESRRRFPTWCEVLGVVLGLGYRKEFASKTRKAA